MIFQLEDVYKIEINNFHLNINFMKRLSLLLLVSVLLFSCGGDDDGDGNTDGNGTMTVIKDGVSFTIDATNNTLVGETQQGQDGRRLDIRCNVDGGTLIIAVSNWDFQNPPVDGIVQKVYGTNEDGVGSNSVCMDSNGFTFCDGGLVTYLVGTDSYVSESLEDPAEGTITITGNDATNKTVSGTFNVIVGKFGTLTPEEITFTGTFTDIPYRVL